MRFYLDENLPSQLAEALNILDKDNEIFSTVNEFGRGQPDEFLIPEIAKEKAVLFTQDFNINRIKEQRNLVIQEELIIFFLRPPSKSGFSYWELVKIIFKFWEEIVKHAKQSKRPCAYIIKPKSGISELDL
jgi:hypothetical protein